MREFSPDFRSDLHDLMKWRRDVRHFHTTPVDTQLLHDCLQSFRLAPSVGLSEPWRIVRVSDPDMRSKAIANYKQANSDALAGYNGDRAALYAGLKLSGMQEAPEHLAIFCAEDTTKGRGLGAQSMPEVRRYSVVSAIMNFWLVTRAHGLGLGWVSILDPDLLHHDLDVRDDWALVAYLCIGWPKQDTVTPELETVGWEERTVDPITWMER